MNTQTECCQGNGWLVVAVDGDDERLRIERCDECELMSDDEARALPAAQTALAEARSKVKRPRYEVPMICRFCGSEKTDWLPIQRERLFFDSCERCIPSTAARAGTIIRYGAPERADHVYSDRMLLRGALYTVARMKPWQHGCHVILKETGNAEFDIALFTPRAFVQTADERLARVLQLPLVKALTDAGWTLTFVNNDPDLNDGFQFTHPSLGATKRCLHLMNAVMAANELQKGGGA